jgi:nitrogen-specific signal transduction histidine kinase
VRNAQGNLICFAGISEDITERKLSEEERRTYEARLMRSQKLEAIGTLAGGIAHDFNNILSAIIGYSELAIGELPPDSAVSTSIKEVLKAGDRAKDLVKQILTFSRQMETERKPVKIHLIIKEALKLLRSSIPSTITITERIDTSAGTVFADSTQIHQVIMNLCTNAYHALLTTGGDLTVSLEQLYLDSGFISKHPPLHEGAHLLITVRDTGYGMDTETLKRIFDPFFTTKEKAKGTGLGLATVHGIVTELGGVILVESWVGKGSTFEIYLPVSQREQEDMDDLNEEPTPGTGESILLVDDEEAIINFTKAMLNQLGYKVKGICSSIDALNYFRSVPDEIDLVITDQTMPGITGSQLATEILKIRPDIPIILMTGYSETITPEEAVAQGIKEYIDKPFTKNMLAGTICRSLKG